jgi:hypothetical protein
MEKIGKVVCNFIIYIHIFFISFIINLFIIFYSIYSMLDLFLFHNKQGSKLKIKKEFYNFK